MSRIAIIGYGKMGKEIEKALLSRNQEIVARIDNAQDWETQWQAFLSSDVAIEFSQPDVAIANFFRCFDHGIPLVSGTTGWYDRFDEVMEHCRKSSNAFIYGTNFSIGVNLFFKIAETMAQLLGNESAYQPGIEEIHHIHKKDAPSGTAITLAETVLPLLPEKSGWTLNQQENAEKLNITAQRIGEVQGVHALKFASIADEIELKHTAKSRAGFAEGAVRAALWLLKHPNIYNFKDIFDEVNG